MVEVRSALVWAILFGSTASLVAVASTASYRLAATFAVAMLPFLVFAGMTILEATNVQAKRRMQERTVLRVSRSVFERLDPEVLQLFLTDRDFTSTDYERLMALEMFNEKKSEGASDSDIRCLPVVSITPQMLKASKNPCCSVCLVNFEVDVRVRMLPCFHHFHPSCIDPWLKEKAQCPVCKCPVIG